MLFSEVLMGLLVPPSEHRALHLRYVVEEHVLSTRSVLATVLRTLGIVTHLTLTRNV